MAVELVLKGGIVALASTGLAIGLAWSGAGQTGPWPVTGALLLGADGRPADHPSSGEPGERLRRTHHTGGDRDDVDLRFRAFVAGALVVVVAALAFPDVLRGAGVVRLALALALVLPLVTVLLAAAADLGARVVAARRARTDLTLEVAEVAGAEGGVDEAEDRASIDELLEEARLELREASTRVTRGHLQAAIEALREALDDYAVAAGGDDGSPELRARVRGVAALARTCAEAEGQDAIRLLGVRPDAGPDEVATVCRALLSLYRGPAALPGVDPARAEALEAAAAQLTRRAA